MYNNIIRHTDRTFLIPFNGTFINKPIKGTKEATNALIERLKRIYINNKKR